ncbi:MAG: hypothetical protein KAJ19_14905 [Gammaproteobacteria bacterium]|nr:hypothetical protein [Gammaproteobacteria bacterium]
MKSRQFHIAIKGVPRYYAVFKVKQVPSEIRSGDLVIGDLMYWNQHRTQMVRVQNSVCFPIGASDLDFITYMTTAEMQEAYVVTNG